MDWTAITGIVVAGVVGPGVSGLLAIKRQDSQQGHERERDDLADLRVLLADSAKDVQQAQGLTEALLGLLLEFGEKMTAEAGPAETIERFKATAREVVLNDARIAIRLDDDPAAEAHRAAALGLQRAANAVGRIGGLGGASNKETYQELNAAQGEIRASCSRFKDAARAKVGSGQGGSAATRTWTWPTARRPGGAR